MRKETEGWIKIAWEDFQSADYLLTKSLYRMVCYHAQQAVEKSLKAILVEHEIDFPRIHNILDLSNDVKKLGFEPEIAERDAIFLNSVYRARYPSDQGLLPKGEPAKEDAERALTIAKNMLEWLKTVIK